MRSHHISITHIICPTITCTAPKNSAFEELDPETIEYLTDPANVDALSNILYYHAVSGNTTSSDLIALGNPSETDIVTLNGDSILVSVGLGGTFGILINDASAIEPFDVMACNGVVHSIDKVLIPPPEPTPPPSPTPCKTIVEIAAGVPEFSTLVSLVSGVPELAAVLSNPDSGPFTLFGMLN